jgi:DNA-directed RNA polymerase specialized sigma24 family protein
MTSNQRSNHYIDGEKMGLLAAQAAESGDLDEELIEMFYLLSYRTMAQYSTQRGFSFRDPEDVVQEAVMRCFKTTLTFDISRLKHAHHAYHFFRVVILQTYSRLQTYYNRQMRKPPGEVVSLDALALTDECPYRCVRQEYFGRDGSNTPHEDTTE